MSKRDDVGYKKPPKKTQWKKGQSGNPSGRPKKSDKDDADIGMWKIFREEMNQLIPVKGQEGITEISAKRALVKVARELAINKRDFRALKMILDCYKAELIESKNSSERDITIVFSTYEDEDNEQTYLEKMRQKNEAN